MSIYLPERVKSFAFKLAKCVPQSIHYLYILGSLKKSLRVDIQGGNRIDMIRLFLLLVYQHLIARPATPSYQVVSHPLVRT